ncbi:hypothetical protein HYW21_03545 [Candidatus Woesearchaeota archaeon]|nr:hypothetical protein [Candidatus Woesearchaeota archaeon]
MGKQKTIETIKKDNHALGSAIVWGLGFSLLGAVLWFAVVVLTEFQFGIVAIGVGYLVGYGVYQGSHHRMNLSVRIISVILALFSLIIAEYLIANHYIHQALVEDYAYTGSYFLAIGPTFSIMLEGLIADPLTFLFWAIALYAAFRGPWGQE